MFSVRHLSSMNSSWGSESVVRGKDHVPEISVGIGASDKIKRTKVAPKTKFSRRVKDTRHRCVF